MTFDAIVVGLGAMGSATAWQLARRGARVLGIDRYAPPHGHGSHCGESRITRRAIGEGDAYVPLALRSCEIWREIESALPGEALLTVTGGLWISSPKRQSEVHVADFFDRTVAAARRFGIAHEVLDAATLRRRHPQFAVRDDESGYFEPEAGFLRPEACVRAQLALAVRAGADLHVNERVLGIEQAGGAVEVTTERGKYRGSQVVVTAGAGIVDIAPALRDRFNVSRQVQFWFEADGHDEVPVWIWELQDRPHAIYGFPSKDGIVKIATESFTREIPPEEMYRSLVAPFVRGVRPRCVKTVACLYTATADFNFLIDRHPAMDRVIVASPCSGHGFKHSAAVGEALAQLAMGQAPGVDLGPFRLPGSAGGSRV
jgi:sarcosine oxidase